MTVELTDEQARALLFAARYPAGAASGAPVSEALAAIARGLERAEQDEPRRSLAEEFLAGWADGVARARHAATAPRPNWGYVARAVRVIEQSVKADPVALAQTDRLGAYVRDTFDALGLSVTDEPTLYVALTTSGLLVEMASNGHRRDQVDHATLEAIAAIAQTFAAALIPYLPPEART